MPIPEVGTSSGSNHTVAVVETELGFLVRPAAVVAHAGDHLLIRNLSTMPAQALLPAAGLVGSGPGFFEIGPGAIVDITLSPGGRTGSFPFQVYLAETPPEGPSRRLFARGESAPHVIIEP